MKHIIEALPSFIKGSVPPASGKPRHDIKGPQFVTALAYNWRVHTGIVQCDLYPIDRTGAGQSLEMDEPIAVVGTTAAIEVPMVNGILVQAILSQRNPACAISLLSARQVDPAEVGLQIHLAPVITRTSDLLRNASSDVPTRGWHDSDWLVSEKGSQRNRVEYSVIAVTAAQPIAQPQQELILPKRSWWRGVRAIRTKLGK